MARTAFTAPAHIVLQRKALGNVSNAPDSAPSLSYAGTLGLMDHRMAWNKYNALGNGAAAMCIGWLPGNFGYVVCDVTAPANGTTANIAALQNVPAGLALTLTAGTGVTTNSNPFVSLPFLNTIPAGTLCIGTLPKYCFVGSRDISAYYDPTSALALAVFISAASGAAGQAFVVRGYDFYGQPMAEQITAVTNTSVSGKKAFKWITSVTGTSAEAENYSVGTTLLAGFHLAVDTAPYAAVSINNATATVPTTFVAALTSAVPTATNADVRGTTAITASDHTVIWATPSVYRLTNTYSGTAFTEPPTPLFVGLFGQVQFTE